jgi:hypothetical protein
MRPAIVVLALSLPSTGCELALYASRDLTYEACLFTDHAAQTIRNCHLAEQAWDEVLRTHPGVVFSADYASGFKDGFADFLKSGGNGDAPALPPRHYWKAVYQTPEGREAVKDWFAGFRQGTSSAKASGLRQVVTVPSSLPPPVPPPGPEPGDMPPGSEVPAPQPETTLPMPRPVSPKDQAPL